MTDADAELRRRREPYRSHHFVVQADGLPTSGFAKVRGLEVELGDQSTDSTPDRTERERNRSGFVHRIVDRDRPREERETTAPNLELWRGVTDGLVLWNWLRDWTEGAIDPRRVGVYLLDGAGVPAVGWVCEDATPVRWSGPKLSADSPGVAMERLELEHGGLAATTDVPSDAFEGLESVGRPAVDDSSRRPDSDRPGVGDSG